MSIAVALSQNGRVIVTGCLGAQPGGDPRKHPERAGRHRPAAL